MNPNKKQFRDIYNKLPQKLREVLASEEYISEIKNIGKNHNLSDIQNDSLCLYTTNILMGIEKEENLREKIEKDFGLTNDVAKKIDLDIKSKVINNTDNLFKLMLVNTKSIEQKNDRDFDINEYVESIKESFSENSNVFERLKKLLNDNSVDSARTKELMERLTESEKNLINDKKWEEKTKEIALKYSLNETQTSILINKILSLFVNLETQDKFLESMILELAISRVLATQIMEDLGKRVFNLPVKGIYEKTKAPLSQVLEKKPLESTPATETSDSIEIRPKIVPMVEKGEVAHNNTIIEEKDLANLIPIKEIAPEPIQAPVPVPKFTAVPLEEESDDTKTSLTKTIEQATPQKLDFKKDIEDKFLQMKYRPMAENSSSNTETTVVEKPTENPLQPISATPTPILPIKPKEKKVESPKPVEPPPKQYSVDPYREPIE